MAQFTFEAIGTTWRIDIYRDLSPAATDELFSAIQQRIAVFDKAYSRFRADSLVTEMSKRAGTFTLPTDAAPMFALYRDLYERTDGLMTPLIGNLIADAGYDAEYSLKQKDTLEAPPTWNDAIEFFSPTTLVIKKPVMLDLGAAGKGYLVDLVGDVLEARGVSEFCIDAGGDILHKKNITGGDGADGADVGGRIRVGLEDPENPAQVIGVCSLGNESICGSAGNRRSWGDFTHIINPKTKTSPRDILAVWVVAKTALVADALATALFFVPATALVSAYDFEYVLVRSDRSLETSPHFRGEFF